MTVTNVFYGQCAPAAPDNRSEQILDFLRTLLHEIRHMNELLDTLAERVAAVETVSASAVLLLGELKSALDEAVANDDLAAVADLSARLEVQTAELAAAVIANTPADGSETEPAPEPEPEPEPEVEVEWVADPLVQ